ncbi:MULTISPECIES: hypothetical protein [unclassified Cupriavidus]|uniref:hypothetical protein n=1 Tax=Cupriavidus sp. H19C3 TaxID=3241603 RepID=UPI003BF80465
MSALCEDEINEINEVHEIHEIHEICQVYEINVIDIVMLSVHAGPHGLQNAVNFDLNSAVI